MTTSISHLRIREWYEAWSRKDWKTFEDLLGASVRWDDLATGAARHGRAECLAYAREWADAFGDGVIRVEHIAGTGHPGHLMLVERRLSGTQTGHLGFLAPTGRCTEIRFCEILKSENERLTEIRSYYDLYRPLVELGHVATQPARAA